MYRGYRAWPGKTMAGLGDRNKCQMLTQRLCGDAGT